jgi:16S rRNA processing protein RimM
MEELRGGESEEYFVVGKVMSTHGVHGEVSVQVWTDRIERFKPGNRLWSFSDDQRVQLTVRTVRKGPRGLIIQFKGIRTPEDAKRLCGVELAIPKALRGDAPEDSWYVSDVIGCEVFTDQDQRLGKVVEVICQPHHDLYVIHGPYGEILLPAIREFIERCELECHRLVVRNLEAFWDGDLA